MEMLMIPMDHCIVQRVNGAELTFPMRRTDSQQTSHACMHFLFESIDCNASLQKCVYVSEIIFKKCRH